MSKCCFSERIFMNLSCLSKSRTVPMKTAFNCCVLRSNYSLKKLKMHLEILLIFLDAKENKRNAQTLVANLGRKYSGFRNMNHCLNKFPSSPLTGVIYNTLALINISPHSVILARCLHIILLKWASVTKLVVHDKPRFNGFTVDELLITTHFCRSCNLLSDGRRLCTGLHGSDPHIHKVRGQ